MRVRTGMLGRVAVLAVLVGGWPAGLRAEVERTSARPDRLLQPLGAGGALDPLVRAASAVERQLASRPQGHEITLRDVLDLGRPAAPSQRDARVATATPLVGITQFGAAAMGDWGRPVAAGDGAPHLLLTAFEPRGVGDRAASSRGEGLPWARAPALPRPLTGPLLPSEPVEVKRLSPARMFVPSPRLARRPRSVQPELLLRLPFMASHRPRSSVPQQAAPRSLAWAAQPQQTAFTPLDPLARPARDARPEKPRTLAAAFVLPFEHGRISSLFNQGRAHPAIDLAGRLGAPVFATSHGQTVIFAGARGGYGNAVVTRDNEGREHLYGHLSAIGTRVGVVLAQGDRLGSLGSTGYSTGPHVHYEVKDRRGAHINPVSLLFPGRAVASGYAWGAVALPDRSATASAQTTVK